MELPPTVIEKAQTMEQLLLKVEAGWSVAEACNQLKESINEKTFHRLRKKYEANGRCWQALLDRRYGRSQKITPVIRKRLYQLQKTNPTLTANLLAQKIQQEFGINVSVGHINYLLRKKGATSSVGRPKTHKGTIVADHTSPDPLPHAGIFFLEAAKQAMGVVETVESVLQQAKEQYTREFTTTSLRVLKSKKDTIWKKLDHLLYLPILGLKRPRDLFYYQGRGLSVLYGFTYKYLRLEHFLGQLTSLAIGEPLANALANCYSQAWYPGQEPLFIFIDWHVKPHWTKKAAHALRGSITMWGRIMPGTKQLLVNGPQGHLLGGWNKPIDSHLSNFLVEVEAELADLLSRPIAYTICDSEGGGLPAAERSASAEHFYISILPRRASHTREAFEFLSKWTPVENDPIHEAAEASWRDAKKASTDPRRLILMRRLHDTDPTRI